MGSFIGIVLLAAGVVAYFVNDVITLKHVTVYILLCTGFICLSIGTKN